MNEKIILPESPEAARKETREVWVSREGRVYEDTPVGERCARWDGSTHRKCECGKILKRNDFCRECSDKKEYEKFMSYPEIEWDGKVALHLWGTDKFFFSEEELYDYCEDHECTSETLPLVTCKPCYAYSIEPYDIYQDILTEDGEVPEAIEAAFSELNKRIKEYDIPICWEPDKFRVKVRLED